MSAFRLHHFPESGNSYKLALMLTLCGEPFEPVWTDFAGGVTFSRAWREAVNPMGEIPVLEVDGERLTQTAPILLMLAERFGRFGGAPGDRFEVLRWLFWDNQKLSGFMATQRFLRAFAKDPGDPAVLVWLRRRCDDFLRILETHLQDRDWVVGDAPTVCDLSLQAYLHYPAEETGYGLAASHPAIAAWLARIAALPGWRSAYDLLPGPRLPLRAAG